VMTIDQVCTSTRLIIHALNFRFSFCKCGTSSMPAHPISLTNHLLNSEKPWITSNACLTEQRDVSVGVLSCLDWSPADLVARATEGVRSLLVSSSQLPDSDIACDQEG
jgi:hypothetical protein